MAAFLVTLPADARFTLPSGVTDLVVFAGSAAEAKDVAKSHFDGDSDAAWASATATEITAASDFSDYRLRVAVLDADPLIEIEAQPSGIAVTAGAIGAGGTGYSADDVVTLGGGTSSRAATFRVTSESGGVVDGIELVDPGEYSVAPAASAQATTGGGGSGLTITPTSSANAVESLYANAVSLLNATAIDGAAMDMGAGSNPLLTIASGGGGDDLGDLQVEVEMLRVVGANKTPIAGMVGTVTDEGSSSDPLTVAFPASQVAGQVLAALKA